MRWHQLNRKHCRRGNGDAQLNRRRFTRRRWITTRGRGRESRYFGDSRGLRPTGDASRLAHPCRTRLAEGELGRHLGGRRPCRQSRLWRGVSQPDLRVWAVAPSVRSCASRSAASRSGSASPTPLARRRSPSARRVSPCAMATSASIRRRSPGNLLRPTDDHIPAGAVVLSDPVRLAVPTLPNWPSVSTFRIHNEQDRPRLRLPDQLPLRRWRLHRRGRPAGGGRDAVVALPDRRRRGRRRTRPGPSWPWATRSPTAPSRLPTPITAGLTSSPIAWRPPVNRCSASSTRASAAIAC